MKLIEIHILQSYPVSCLNRDDVGSPKSAMFGGVRRARISSQCLKRASRMMAKETWPEARFAGIRTRFIQPLFLKALIDQDLEEAKAEKIAKELAAIYSTVDKENEMRVKTPVFLSPGEVETVAKLIKGGEPPKKAAQKATAKDAADICLFGRMIANDATMNVEGAAMFSHALSTHKADSEIDYFSAVPDPEFNEDVESSGADHVGTLEYNSATYYRYFAVNLDLLGKESHLGGLSDEVRKEIVAAFIRAGLLAVPNARKNSMNAGTLPFEVLGIRKEKGQPLQLVNAFESPVKANGAGLQQASLDAMKDELEKVERVWGGQGEKFYLTETEGGLDAFIGKLLEV